MMGRSLDDKLAQVARTIEQQHGQGELLRAVNEARGIVAAYRDTERRSEDAHAFAQKYLMPSAWGENVWHAILNDATRLRAALTAWDEAYARKERD